MDTTLLNFHQTRRKKMANLDTVLTKKETEHFINLYREHECLWNTSLDTYKIALYRQLALKDIARKIGKGWSVNHVRKKWEHLKTTYQRNLKQMISSERSGCALNEVFKPKWWVFPLLDSFLRPQTTNQQSNLPVVSKSEDQFQEPLTVTHIVSLRPEEYSESGSFSRNNPLIDGNGDELLEDEGASDDSKIVSLRALQGSSVTPSTEGTAVRQRRKRYADKIRELNSSMYSSSHTVGKRQKIPTDTVIEECLNSIRDLQEKISNRNKMDPDISFGNHMTAELKAIKNAKLKDATKLEILKLIFEAKRKDENMSL